MNKIYKMIFNFKLEKMVIKYCSEDLIEIIHERQRDSKNRIYAIKKFGFCITTNNHPQNSIPITNRFWIWGNYKTRNDDLIFIQKKHFYSIHEQMLYILRQSKQYQNKTIVSELITTKKNIISEINFGD